MTIKKELLEEFCAEVYPDDGQSPKEMRRRTRKNKNDHRRLRLCKVAGRAVDDVMASSTSNPALVGVRLLRVEEATNGSTLTAVFSAPVGLTTNEVEARFQALSALTGLFRTAVARTINRKKTPEVRVQVVPVAEKGV